MTPEQKILEDYNKKFYNPDQVIEDKNTPYIDFEDWLSSALKSYRQEIEKPFKHQKVMYQLGRRDALDEVRKALPKGKELGKDDEYQSCAVDCDSWNACLSEIKDIIINKLK